MSKKVLLLEIVTRHAPTLTLLIVVALVVGCGEKGPDIVPATGSVSKDGTPVAGADVAFIPDGEGLTSSGTTDGSGKFQLVYGDGRPGVLPGHHRVTVILNASVVSAEGAQGGGEEDPSTFVVPEPIEVYTEVDVSAEGTNDFKLEF